MMSASFRDHEHMLQKPATLRPAAASDLDSICRIYNDGIAERSSTFETRWRDPAELAAWLLSPRHPLWVAESSGIVVGWARISPYSDRECYRGIGELSVYVDSTSRRQQLGSRMTNQLILAARDLGYWKIIGKILSENEGSRALCRRCGFREVGTFYRHGQMGSEWKDVILVEVLL